MNHVPVYLEGSFDGSPTSALELPLFFSLALAISASILLGAILWGTIAFEVVSTLL
jgi:hypothetical protein